MRQLGYVIVAFVVFAAIYVSSYYAMVGQDTGEDYVVPHYRFGGQASRSVFAPLHEADRAMRPEYWRNEPRRKFDPKMKGNGLLEELGIEFPP